MRKPSKQQPTATPPFQGMYHATVTRQWWVEIAPLWCLPGDEVFVGSWPNERKRLRLYTASTRKAAIAERMRLSGPERTPYLADLRCLADCTAVTISPSHLLKIPPGLMRPILGSKPPFDIALTGLGQYIELMEVSAYEAMMASKTTITAGQELPDDVKVWFNEVFPMDFPKDESGNPVGT